MAKKFSPRRKAEFEKFEKLAAPSCALVAAAVANVYMQSEQTCDGE